MMPLSCSSASGVGEDDVSQYLPVNLRVRQQDVAAKGLHHRPPGRGPRRVGFMSKECRVFDDGAMPRQNTGDLALARADAPRKPNDDHVLSLNPSLP